MAEWLNKEKIYFGDAFGNARAAWIGIVTIDRRTSIGIQFNLDSERDLPDYTLDGLGASDLATELQENIKRLTEGGGFR